MSSSSDASDEDLQDLFDHAPCGYLSLTPGGQIVRANATLANWLGTIATEVVGRPLFDILTFGGRIAFETHMAPLLRLRGAVDELAFDLLRADGGKIPIIANAAEKRDDHSQHQFTRITMFRAIERRSYEKGLLDARSKAEFVVSAEQETAALREQFIAVLGHDLRNPLAAIAAGIGLLDKNEPLSANGHRIVQKMQSSVDRANSLVSDVLDLARGRLGGGLLLERNDAEPLTPVLEHVVSEVRLIAPDRVVIAEFNIAEPINCDRRRIGQLASNLLANAVTHGAADVPIRLMAATAGRAFTLWVANGGPEIPADARDQLFQPFFRGAARRSQQGLGLGLFIVNEIAKAHDGTMTVTSTDVETRFTFQMPLIQP